MFWKLTSLSASSPDDSGAVHLLFLHLYRELVSKSHKNLAIVESVESILDKEDCTLEELLDEEEIIQECKALNSRLINFLRDRDQVEQLLRYIVEEPQEDAESKRAFKFPFIACEIFTCEIDVILKTLVEDKELMNLLFSFLDSNRPHSAFLAGYFSKVVVCLMLRKTVPLMNYVKEHQDVFRQLVDLIGITSIMEVLVRLVGADDHMYSNFSDVMQWLADSNLIEMIVDKLNPSNPPEVHANAAETLCAITRNSLSPLAKNLSSPSFVARIFGHALEYSHSKSGLVHSLSVCISLLDPRRSAGPSPMFHSFRSQHMYESPVAANSETVCAMLPKLGDLLMLLNVSSDETVLPTTYGQLRPPLGKHRLKIVEFIAVLLKTASDVAEKELISSGTIQRVLDLFFEYPYNNALHHHVESVIGSCLESKNDHIITHLLRECDLIGKIIQTDKCSVISSDGNQPTSAAAGRTAPRVGNIGHLTRISNKLLHLANNSARILSYIQENSEWSEWRATVLAERNAVENVYRWGCGRPTALQDRTRDSDDDDFNDRDYDVAALANNLSQAFRYNIYENEDNEEDRGALDRDDEDVYFDDESAAVVISSLRLGDDQGSSLFTNSNWFAFPDDTNGKEQVSTSPSQVMYDINFNGTANGGNSSSDDEVVVGEDEELATSKDSSSGSSDTNSNGLAPNTSLNHGDIDEQSVIETVSQDMEYFPVGTQEDENMSGDRSILEREGCGESLGVQVGGSNTNPFLDDENSDTNLTCQSGEVKASVNSSGGESSQSNGSSTTASSPEGSVSSGGNERSAPSLFEEDVEFVGVEPEGTEKAMEHALKEGIVGEAGPLKRNPVPKVPENENSNDDRAGKEFNDTNYWKIDQNVAVQE